MALTVDQKTAAIKAAADIVIALVEHTPTFKGRSDAAEQGANAAAAFKAVYAQIKASAG